MKSEMEIQRAHDLIAGLVLGEAPLVFGENEGRAAAALDTLCWVLGHQHAGSGTAFEKNLIAAEAEAAAMGFVLERKDPINASLRE